MHRKSSPNLHADIRYLAEVPASVRSSFANFRRIRLGVKSKSTMPQFECGVTKAYGGLEVVPLPSIQRRPWRRLVGKFAGFVGRRKLVRRRDTVSMLNGELPIFPRASDCILSPKLEIRLRLA